MRSSPNVLNFLESDNIPIASNKIFASLIYMIALTADLEFPTFHQ